jgi:hypothetical protein
MKYKNEVIMMIRIISISTLGLILLISTMSFAGDELSPAYKNMIFSSRNKGAGAQVLDTTEMTNTTEKRITVTLVIQSTITIPPNLPLIITLPVPLPRHTNESFSSFYTAPVIHHKSHGIQRARGRKHHHPKKILASQTPKHITNQTISSRTRSDHTQ